MRAIALTEAPGHVCGRYRVSAFAPALARAGWTVDVEGIARGVVARLRQLDRTREYDAVILQRKLLPGWQLSRLRRRAQRLLFDFDDAVLHRDSYDPRGPHSARRASRFARTMRIADVVIAGNDFLADCALRSGARPEQVRVIPTCVATETYPIAEPSPRAGTLNLAWIGSSSTLAGLESQRALWDQVGRDVPGTRLRLICDRSADLGALPVVPVPWTEATEAAELSRADVGLSWIPDDLWSQGKCGLKILQYQAAGLVAVANPIGVHGEMIEHGETGFLATTADEWIEAVRLLRDDPVRRAAMGRAARRSVEIGYSVAAWSPTFVAALTGRALLSGPKFRSFPARAALTDEPSRERVDLPAGT